MLVIPGYAWLDISHMAVTAPCRLLIPLVTLFFLACVPYVGSADMSNKVRQKILLDINSNSKNIELEVGDEIQIELKAVGSAGYAWYFDKLDQDFFDLIGEEQKLVTPQKEDVVGTPVVMVWKLRAKKPGKGFIRMLYYRQWEGKEKAANQFEIRVEVTP